MLPEDSNWQKEDEKYWPGDVTFYGKSFTHRQFHIGASYACSHFSQFLLHVIKQAMEKCCSYSD